MEKSLKDMNGIEAIERLINGCDINIREEIAARFGGELKSISQDAKEKMKLIPHPTENDEKHNTKYFQAYLACRS